MGCNVTLRIVGANTLTSTVPDTEGEDRFSAGLQVEGSAVLTILSMAPAASLCKVA